MNVGFAICGSFCTFSKIFPIMKSLQDQHSLTPIFSEAAYSTDTRFGTAAEHIRTAETICRTATLHSIVDTEPVGPRKQFDILVIAPCTGNTLAKLAHGIADGPVTMAAKSHLRNGRPILIAISTNDALSTAAENIAKLMIKKHYYFVPYSQDDCASKPYSMVADFSYIPQAMDAALKEQQIQPIIIR